MNLAPIQTGLPALGTPAAPGKAAAANDAGKIEESARQFEAMLVRQVLADTFKPTSATGGPAAPGADIYQGFVTDIVADHISRGGSLGISHLLQSQLQPSVPTHAAVKLPHA